MAFRITTFSRFKGKWLSVRNNPDSGRNLHKQQGLFSFGGSKEVQKNIIAKTAQGPNSL
jgi:hypothetical protein